MDSIKDLQKDGYLDGEIIDIELIRKALERPDGVLYREIRSIYDAYGCEANKRIYANHLKRIL